MGTRIIIQNKSTESSPIIVDLNDCNKSMEEAFPHVGTLIFKGNIGIKNIHSISDVVNLPELNGAVKKIPDYVKKKGWVVLDKNEANSLPKTFWTKLGGASDSSRDNAKTETWKTVQGVPLCIIEQDYYQTTYIDNGSGVMIPITTHIHNFDIYCFLKKDGVSTEKAFARLVACLKVKDRKGKRKD